MINNEIEEKDVTFTIFQRENFYNVLSESKNNLFERKLSCLLYFLSRLFYTLNVYIHFQYI